jgi:hypothetical protein
MMKHILLSSFVVLAILTVFSNCSTTLQATKPDESGYFPTSTKIAQDDIRVQKPFLEKYCTLLYVMTDVKDDTYNDFFVVSFVNMNMFAEVLDKEGLEKLVIEKGLTDSVTSISDKIGLYNLQSHMGAFLVVEPYTMYMGGDYYSAELKAFDPETGETVFHVTNEAINWAGLDKPLFYPLFNAFIDWTHNRPIETMEKPGWRE